MIACFDVGGTSVKYGIAHPGGRLTGTGSFRSINDAPALFDAIAATAREMARACDIEGVALSTPGTVDPAGTIGGQSALPCIHGPNWIRELGDRTGLPVTIENDGSSAALAECHLGAARGYELVAVAVTGSGVGGAVVYRGDLLRGVHGCCGEFGYMVVDQADGMLRTYSNLAASEALARGLRALKGDDSLGGIDAFRLEREGDEGAAALVRRFYREQAIGVYNIQYSIDPELILLGGAVTRQPDYLARLRAAIDEVVLELDNPQITPRVERCALGPEANLVGAYVNFCLRTGYPIGEAR